MTQVKMKKNLFFLLIACPCIWAFHTVSAQSLDRHIVTTAGTNQSNGEYSISYTIGEPVSGTLNHDGQINQGFQQSWAIVTAVDPAEHSLSGVSIYPNPTVGQLTIKAEEDLQVFLFDLHGQKLKAYHLDGVQNQIDISELPIGQYILNLQSQSGPGSESVMISKVQ